LLMAALLPVWACGHGGIGRRATLRSLWAKARGSSSLLGRTSPFSAMWRNQLRLMMIAGAIRPPHTFLVDQSVIFADISKAFGVAP
jgi:hypothetical protein